MRNICSQEIFTRKCWQQQNFDSDPKEAWHYNHVTFTSIAKNFMLYCRLIYMLSMLYVRLTIKVKVAIPESFKVGWYPHKITGSSHLKWFWTTFSVGAPVVLSTKPIGGLEMIDICFRDWSGSSEEHLRAYLLKTSILGEIVFEILAPFCSRLDTIPFKFDSVYSLRGIACNAR